MTSIYNAAVKAEPMNGQSPVIKQDPDLIGVSDEDIYEDTGDLDFTAAEQNIFLTRIPKFLYESWSKLDDDQEITVGTIRVEGSPRDVKRMSLLLDPNLAKNRSVPKEYNMHITNHDSVNTFVFSEKDLPGFRHFSHERAPPHYTFQDRKKVEKSRKQSIQYRKAVPKQTNLAGRVRTEINCLPVENAEYQRLMDERTKMALRPKRETQLVKGVVAGGGGNILNPGTLGATGNFQNFIKQSGPLRGKRQENKAARMPQNELLDLIYECFKEYTYWPLKSMVKQLNQPEAYLRQTLEMVAVMIRSGTYATKWQLKPEAREGAYAEAGSFNNVKDEVAPETGIDSEAEVVDDDDDNVKMEDVMFE